MGFKALAWRSQLLGSLRVEGTFHREPSAPGRHGNCMNSSLSYFLSILWFVLWIVAIVDCARSNNPNKIVWIVVIILLPFLGSILYFLFARRTA